MSFLSKVVAISDEKCLMFGGASDIKQSKVYPFVFEACANPKSLTRKKDMHQARAAFGCFLDKEFKNVYVIGGSINQNEATDRCEVYDIENNKWTDLPRLEMGLCSSSVVSTGRKSDGTGPRYLFCFGGISKSNGELNIISDISRLDLKSLDSWIRIPVSMSKPLCDIGLSILSDKDVLVFGGWNYNSYDSVCKLTNYE